MKRTSNELSECRMSMDLTLPTRVVLASLAVALGLLVLHGSVAALASFEAVHSIMPAFRALVIFWCLFAISAILTLRSIGRDVSNSRPSQGYFEQFAQSRTLALMLAITLVGLALHVYAKYYLTTIRPISCLFEIRFAWIEVPHERLPTHVRFASFMGHLLTSFAFAGSLFSSWGVVRPSPSGMRWHFAFYLVAFFLCGVVFSGFIGSRNAMLAYVVVNCLGVVIGVSASPFTLPTILRAISVCLLPAIIGLTFSSAVFSDRMYCGAVVDDSATPQLIIGKPSALSSDRGEYSATYMGGFFDEFSIRHREQQITLASGVRNLIEQRCELCGPTFLYLNHGIINFAQVLSTELRGDRILFNFAEAIGRRVGVITSDPADGSNRVYGPGGLPLAGAAFHDFGWGGLAVVAISLGFILGVGARQLQYTGPRFGLGLTFLGASFYTMSLSNMFVAPSVISFPFIVFSMFFSFVVFPWVSQIARAMGKIAEHP